MADTGQGATIVFTTSGFTASWKEFGEQQDQGGSLNITDLARSGANKFMPQDNYDAGTRALLLHFAAEDGLPDLHVPESVTITYPIETSGNTAATEAGTAWLESRTMPKLANNEVMMATLVLRWETEPTYTAEA